MGQYVKWAEELGITGLKKDDFYTNETLKGWYKDYVNGLLNHTNPYTNRKLKDEPSVFAWELSNEPRCNTDAQCKDNILYNWAKEMSEYVKSIDPNHMVSLGDEGFSINLTGITTNILHPIMPFTAQRALTLKN